MTLPPKRSRTTATASPRKSLTRAGTSAISSRRRCGALSSSRRSPTVSPGRNPLFIRLSSAPVTKTTSAPRRRSRSARSAQSARSASISSAVRSQGNGENQTSRPASAAKVAASSSRSGSPPVMRTALQCRSSRMMRISRRPPRGRRARGSSRLVDEAGVVADAVAPHASPVLPSPIRYFVPYWKSRRAGLVRGPRGTIRTARGSEMGEARPRSAAPARRGGAARRWSRRSSAPRSTNSSTPGMPG